MLKMDASSLTKIQCPIAIEWPIEKECLRQSTLKKGEYLRSDQFKASNISGVKYSLAIIPHIHEEKPYTGETCIYLNLKNSNNFKVQANFIIKVETASSTNYIARIEHIFTHTTGGWGQHLCSNEELFHPASRYFIDGYLTIKMNGILTIEKEMPVKVVSFGDHRDALCLGLWNQEEDKNFAIIAEDKSIMVHKCILAVRSPVFARMFSSGMKESEENKVEIKDFSFKIIEMAIKFCYHHSLVTESLMDEKMQLLQFFDKYDIQPLKDDLEAYLITEISDSTVCRLVNASFLSNATKLEKKCTEFLQCCFVNLPIVDLDILDDDYFALNLFKNPFIHVSK